MPRVGGVVVVDVPRRPREILPGGIYHVFFRGNDRREIFADDQDRHVYLAILAGIANEYGWNKLAHCLMNNHVHLLLETPQPNLSEGMQRIQLRYSKRFNRRHNKTGHVFGGRFGSKRITADEQLITVTSYIEANPVEAGLCVEPDSWEWTDSHLARRRCREISAAKDRRR